MILLCNQRFLKLLLIMIFLASLFGSVTSYINRARPVSNLNQISGKVIVIDPGHGGVDIGASYDNMVEKEINLDIARRLRSLLSTKGAKVIMTRYHDTALDHKNQAYKSRHMRDLKARVDIINNNKADLFISIHVNSFAGKFRIRGPIVFYQNSKKSNQSLAKKIQYRLNQISYQGVKLLDNSIRVGNYYILKNSRVVGVLIEVGFINKKVDNWLLTENKFKDKLVYGIYQGILDYY